MLRKAVLVIALCVFMASALAVATGAVGASVLMVWGAIIAAGIAYERFRYKPLARALLLVPAGTEQASALSMTKLAEPSRSTSISGPVNASMSRIDVPDCALVTIAFVSVRP